MKLQQKSLESYVSQVSFINQINLTPKEVTEVVNSFSQYSPLIRIGVKFCSVTNSLLMNKKLKRQFVLIPVVKSFHSIVLFAVRMKECERAE